IGMLCERFSVERSDFAKSFLDNVGFVGPTRRRRRTEAKAVLSSLREYQGGLATTTGVVP
ncbi:MAG TPA: hypothetical protein VIS99_12430, partial [Terrimicrobiaceae bacterium]